MSSIIALRELVEKLKYKNLYIPLLQRNYKWPADSGKINAKKLAEDLYKNFKKEKDTYTLGMFTLKESNDDAQILDGQQRTITLTLIIRYLGNKSNCELAWLDFKFERDEYESASIKKGERYTYLQNIQRNNKGESVDTDRMQKNFDAIGEYLDNVLCSECKSYVSKCNFLNDSESKRCMAFYDFIMSHVKVLYRETTGEPLDEFLNINANKTPFCISDYIKSYMVNDISQNSGNVSLENYLKLWKRLAKLLYSIEETCNDSEHIELYKFISQGYDELLLSHNRLEIFFSDRYEMENKLEKYQDTKIEKYPALENEYNRLYYYYLVLKSIKEEMHVVDKKGHKHPNVNVYNAFNLLHTKSGDNKFFKLFREEDVLKKTDTSEVLKREFRFNLTEKSYENYAMEPDTRNQFMESQLLSSDGKKDRKIEMIHNVLCADWSKSDDIYWNAFNSCFEEYVDIIEAGKYYNQFEQTGKKTLYDLLRAEKIENIRIPNIQRDYVMGGNKKYLQKYLRKISAYYFKAKKKNIRALLESDVEGFDEESDAEKVYMSKIINNDDMEQGVCFKNPFKSVGIYSKKEIEDYIAKFGNIIDIYRPKDYRRNSEKVRVSSQYNDVNKVLNQIKIDENALFKGRFVIKDSTSGIENDVNSDVETNEKFNLSCVMGHIEDEIFWVYDGQQRLTTSVYLCAFILIFDSNNPNKEEYRRLLRKFSFNGRENANWFLNYLCSNERDDQNIDDILYELKKKIDGHTTYSIYQLLKEFYNHNTQEKDSYFFSVDYLMKNMEFEFAVIDELGEAEQLFMDMNEGLQLEDYEIYKAELNYRVSKILNNKNWALKMDNEWLDMFFRSDSDTVDNDKQDEWYEVQWIQYCFQMSYIEQMGINPEYVYNKASWLRNISASDAECIINRVISVLDKTERWRIDNKIDIKELIRKKLCRQIFISKKHKFGYIFNEELNFNKIKTWIKVSNYNIYNYKPLFTIEKNNVYFSYGEYIRFVKYFWNYYKNIPEEKRQDISFCYELILKNNLFYSNHGYLNKILDSQQDTEVDNIVSREV